MTCVVHRFARKERGSLTCCQSVVCFGVQKKPEKAGMSALIVYRTQRFEDIEASRERFKYS
jgi:hypothetical protein